jgi:hypothetical protein
MKKDLSHSENIQILKKELNPIWNSLSIKRSVFMNKMKIKFQLNKEKVLKV